MRGAWNVINSLGVVSLIGWAARLSCNADGRARQIEAKTAANVNAIDRFMALIPSAHAANALGVQHGLRIDTAARVERPRAA